MRGPFTPAELERLLDRPARQLLTAAEIARTVERLRALVAEGDAEGVLDALTAAVVDFEPSDDVRAQARRRSAAALRDGVRKHA